MDELSPEQFNRAKETLLEAIDLPVPARADLIAQRTSDDPAVMQYTLRWLSAFEKEPEATIGTAEISHEALGQVLRDHQPAADAAESQGAAMTCPACGAPGPAGAFVCPIDRELLVDSRTTIAGKTIDGVYRVGKRLGKGGMGSVYEAWHEILQTRMAIKVIALEYASHPGFVERFKREGRAVMAVEHPSLVKLHDLKPSADGILYMVLEYVEGDTLGLILRRRRCLPLREAIDLLAPVADALDAAHKAGVVHRDLKPDNIMVSSRDGRPFVKLMDLGIARLRRPDSTPANDHTQLTSPGAIIGTPGYMSPEQLSSPDSGELAIDGRADVYSLGVVFHEVLNGCRPFEGRLPKPAEPLPEAVTAAIHRALSRDRHERQATAGDLVAEIRSAVENESRRSGEKEIGTLVTAAPRSPDENPGSVPAGGRKAVLAASAVIVFLVVTVAAFGMRGWSLSPAAPAGAPAPAVSQPVRTEVLTFWFEARTSDGKDWIPLSGPVPAGIDVRLQFVSPERGYLYLVAPIGEAGEYTALLTDLDYEGEAANMLVPGRILSCKQSIKLGTQQPETRFLVVLSTDPIEILPSLNRRPEARLSSSELVVIETLLAQGRNRHVSLVDGVVNDKTVTTVSVDEPPAGSPSTVAFELVIRPGTVPSTD